MEHSIERIAGKPSDYKYCNECGRINWYENTNCISCPSVNFDAMTEDDASDLKVDWEEESPGLDYEMEV